MFVKDAPGSLVAIHGSDQTGDWSHRAFVPHPLPERSPELTGATYRRVADARAALAALDSTARQLPDPTLFRQPALRREAQSTSALEGTYAPLDRVLRADEDAPGDLELTEILNYVRMAEHGYGWVEEGRPLNATLLMDLQRILMAGTPLAPTSGAIRDIQVVIGVREGAPMTAHAIHAARFIPPPPGPTLESGVRDLLSWMGSDLRRHIDPVVSAAMAHYQFEALHPFRDGNGRLGRLLIVLHLLQNGVLHEPTLTVSRWFEARRADYYDRLLEVSTRGSWDPFISFFAAGLTDAAQETRRQMLALSEVRDALKESVRESPLRAESAVALIDIAVARPSFTVRQVESDLNLSYGRANRLVSQLTEIGILEVLDPNAYKRRFIAPRVLDVLLDRTDPGSEAPT
ncbi:Fic family protein [Georgenia alba]|uniref:Fic family protein n=1 Tax=Georgenia alba TaxID=2233858 RepID=A0ABW2Q8B4_9MICO